MREDEAIYQISGYVITQTSQSGRNIKRSETRVEFFLNQLFYANGLLFGNRKSHFYVSAQLLNILWIIAKSEDILVLKLKNL